MAPDGEALASALPFTRQNLSNRKEFIDASSRGEFSVGEYAVGRVSGVQILPFAFPVRDEVGKLLGVLIATLRLQDLKSVFDLSLLPEESFVGLADHKGKRLYRYPEKDTNPVGEGIAPSVWAAAQRAQDKDIFTDAGSDGMQRIFAVRRLRIAPDQTPYLNIFVGIPEGHLLATADAVTRTHVAWLFVSLAFSGLLTWLVAKYGIHQRIADLVDVAQRLGRGNLAARSGLPESRGMLGNLARALDDMATALERDNMALLLAKKAQEEQQHILETILEQALAGYWDWRIQDGEEYLSPTFKSMFGYADHELPNSPETWQGLILPEDLPKVLAVFDRHVESRGEFPYYNEVRYRHKDGSIVWVICTGKVISWDRQGKPLRMVGCHIDITERKRIEDAVTSSLREKEVLLREIHHRVKNNLQIISSLLGLQEQGTRHPEALRILAESRGRVMSMALIHERLYRSQDLSGINIGEYLRGLLPRLAELHRGKRDIAVRIDAAHLSLDLDQAIPFGLVVNELVTNAFKHAFAGRDHGTITITVSAAQDRMTIVVRDDGIGMAEPSCADSTASLGLPIVGMLIKQLHGEISFASDAGTVCTIVIPLRAPAAEEA